MMNDLPKILERINKKRLTRLLIDAVDQYSPSYAEDPALKVFSRALKHARINYQRQPVPSVLNGHKRGNIIIQLGPSPAHLLWVGHVDTVALWYEGDYRTEIEGDKFYGLGAADMKGGCAAIVEALIAVVESGITLKRGLTIALVVGEEEYGDGSQALLNNVSAPLTIIGEPTGLLPCTAHYGYLECRLHSEGRRSHAALPELGANAIHAMLDWIVKIVEGSRDLKFANQIAVNPREIQGGEPGFVVAESCEAAIDFHLPPSARHSPLENVIKKARQSVLKSHREIGLKYKRLFWSPGFRHKNHDKRLQPLRRAFEHSGFKWETGAFRSHSDATIFHRAGMFPVVCGPGSLEVAHRREEFISLKELESAAHLYAAIIYEVCIR